MAQDEPEAPEPEQPSRTITFDQAQLQSKYKHAKDFGISGNYNPENVKQFQQALADHVVDPDVSRIAGTLRGVPVTHYYDPATRLDVITTPDGKFITGWKLSTDQAVHVEASGDLGGG